MSVNEASLKAFAQGVKLSNQAMNSMTHMLDKIQDQMKKMTTVTDAYAASLKTVSASQNEANKAMKATEKKTEKKTGGMWGAVQNLFSADKVLNVGLQFGKDVLQDALGDQKMIDLFAGQTGSMDKGRAMFEKFQADAIAAGQDVGQSLKSTLSFVPMVENTEQLDQLTKLSQQMSVFDTAGKGMEGAAEVLKEVMSGKTDSLASRFNLSKSDIAASDVGNLGKSGDVDGLIAVFDQLLEKGNMGKEIFDSMLQSPAKQIDILKGNIQSAFSGTLGESFQAIAPHLEKINQAFQAGKFQVFFESLKNGLTTCTEIMGSMIDAALQVAEIILSNWTFFEPIIWGVVAALGAWQVISLIAAIATGGLTTAWQSLSKAIESNAFFIIAAAIVAVIVYIYKLWQTNDEFAAGLMRTGNKIIGFIDKIGIGFFKVAAGIANAMYAAKVSVLTIVEGIVNSIISGINKLINLLNTIPGVSLEALSTVDFSSKAMLEAEAARQANEDQLKRLEKDAAFRAYVRELKVEDMLNNRALQKQEEQIQNIEHDFGAPENHTVIDRVNQVGKINETVDISSEDLKTMRELAELKNIQNFVTMTPTVSVQTGDITQGSLDVEMLLNKITTALEQDIASSAEGVFA